MGSQKAGHDLPTGQHDFSSGNMQVRKRAKYLKKKKKNIILCLAKLSFKSEGENGGISSPVDLSPENS